VVVAEKDPKATPHG
jgi:hypothetical protein